MPDCRFFEVGHGADNHVESFLPSEVLFYCAKWDYDQNNDWWIYDVAITFKNGARLDVSLTEKGYQQFIDVVNNGESENG